MTQTLEGEKNTTEFDQSKEFMIGSTKKYFFFKKVIGGELLNLRQTKIFVENKEALKLLSSEQRDGIEPIPLTLHVVRGNLFSSLC